MNQKNSLGLNKCFMDLADPIALFDKWYEENKSRLERKDLNS